FNKLKQGSSKRTCAKCFRKIMPSVHELDERRRGANRWAAGFRKCVSSICRY
uniref:Perinerin n=1 Tax=Perinereis aibuhitensis TaxID=126650 RepID=PERI_PERAI|nr:RecName: Full=Perinerin [Perinereis aibuhitensis]